MMKKIIFFLILVLLLSSIIVFATKSSDEFLKCVSKEIYKKCDMGISICESFEKGCPESLKSISKSDIFDLLTTIENKIPDKEPFDPNGKLILACENKKDYYQFIRKNAGSYNFKDSFGTQNIDCPKYNINLYIKIGIGIFSITILGVSIKFAFNLWRKYKKKKKTSKTNTNELKKIK